MKKIESLNDLSITIHEINKHYNINNFVDECKREMGSLSDLLMTGLSGNDGLINPVRRILELSKVVPDGDLDRMIDVCEKLNIKYDYTRYLTECENARGSFLKDRSDYFSAKVLSKPDRKDESLNIFDLSATTDYLLADWIDKILQRLKGNSIQIIYEDLNGKTVRDHIRHHPEILFHKDGSIETRLIDRHHGLNAYDSFLLRSFYSSLHGRWVLIPIRLIIKLECSEEFDSMLDDESKKSRGLPSKTEHVEDDDDDTDLKNKDNPDYY